MDGSYARLILKNWYRYKPANLNMLQIAIRTSDVDTELLDFLLAKNISPLEADVTG